MISAYDIGNTAFDKNGDVVLMPISAKVHIVAAGKYDLALDHPIDQDGKWTHLVPEAIIKAPIPEELIENAFAGLEVDVYQTTVAGAALRSGPSEPTSITYSSWVAGTSYAVGSKVTAGVHNYQLNSELSGYEVYTNPAANGKWARIADMTEGSPVLVKLKLGAELYYVATENETWYQMSTNYGLEGYIKQNQVEYVRHQTPSQTTDRIITEQLFRIRKVTVDTKKMTISVSAEHVSYDLNGVLVNDLEIVRQPPAQSIAWIENSFLIPYQGMIASNIIESEDRLYSAKISGRNGTYAMLDPNNGVVAQFKAAFRRDNWDMFVMEKTNTDRGFRIRYGNNMTGVSWNISTEKLVTRIVPVAKDEDGSDLYLDDTIWVDSPNINNYPVIRMERIKVDGQVGKDDGTQTDTTWTAATLRAEMEKQAQARYDIDKCDEAMHEITIDFVRLGDTDEYKQFKDLQKVRLYDKVIAIDERIGLSVSVEVVEIEFDAVNERIDALKLSNVEGYNLENVAGFNVLNNSITGDKLTDSAQGDIVSTATEEAAAFTNDRVNNLNYNLRSWVTNNFQPL